MACQLQKESLKNRVHQSFLAACAVVDCIVAAKEKHVSADVAMRLQQLHETFMRKHVSAYGRGFVKPKHHWGFDVAQQLRRDKTIYDCFVVERMHLRAKRLANLRVNTNGYEGSVALGVALHQLNTLQQKSLEHYAVRLEGETAELLEAPGTTVSKQATNGRWTVAAGDLVFYEGILGEVLACARCPEAVMLIVLEHRHVERLSQHSSTWARTCSIVWAPFQDAVAALAWQEIADDRVTVIV